MAKEPKELSLAEKTREAKIQSRVNPQACISRADAERIQKREDELTAEADKAAAAKAARVATKAAKKAE